MTILTLYDFGKSWIV